MNFNLNSRAFMRFVYNWSIRIYGALLFVAQLFSKKAQLWVAGRKDWRTKLADISNGKEVIWVHVSSHGEFEQGKTVIDGLFDQYPNHHLLLTFFSPSGYELLNEYGKAHTVSYLPLDTVKQANDFVNIVQPKVALFVKYDFWYNYLDACFQSNVPVIFFSSSFRESQVFFRFSGKWFLDHLKQCNRILVRDLKSEKLLEKFDVKNSNTIGDTRFDSVIENTKTVKSIDGIEKFIGEKKLVIFGSTWPEDEKIVLPWLNASEADIKVIIAPHEIDKEKIQALKSKIKLRTALHSSGSYSEAQVLILDCVGVLKHLYQYSSVNYVGGGFGTGIHNLLEPTSFGRPVLFGPNSHKFLEARELIELGAGYEVVDPVTFSRTMNLQLIQSDHWDDEKLKTYFNQNSGATDKVLSCVKEVL
jgi:3-deoxy-D-manno-octulosonic-acid transferase